MKKINSIMLAAGLFLGAFGTVHADVVSVQPGATPSFLSRQSTVNNGLNGGEYAFRSWHYCCGNFDDQWGFSLGANAKVTVSLTDWGGSFPIDGLKLTLKDKNGVKVGSSDVGGNFSVNLLGGQKYSIFVDGDLSNFGASGIGNYKGFLSVQSVPLPCAAWLFGSGLLGLMRWRKRK